MDAVSAGRARPDPRRLDRREYRRGERRVRCLDQFSVFRILFQFAFLLLPSVLTVAVVASLGRRISPATATIAALGAAFSIAPIYYGFLSANAMEPLPALLALLAVWCLTKDRPTLAGVAIGAGAALKLFPLLLLPVAIVFVDSWKARVRLTLASAAVVLAVTVPPAVANLEVFLSPIRWQSGRPAWESWYAFINWVTSAPHEFRAPYFADISVGDGFGWVFWGITPRISALISPVPAAPLRWENLVGFAGAGLMVLICWSAETRSMLALFRWCLFALAGFMFWSPGWSPQYELYVVPFVLLAVRPPGVGLVAALLLEGLTLLEYPVLLPWAYFYGGSMVWIMWAAAHRAVHPARLAVRVRGPDRGPSGRAARSSARSRRHAQRQRAPPTPSGRFGSGTAPGRRRAHQLRPGTEYRRLRQSGCDAPRNRRTLSRRMRTGRSPPATSLVRPGMGRRPDSPSSTTTSARFWTEFQRLGGWRELGYPRRVASPGTACCRRQPSGRCCSGPL